MPGKLSFIVVVMDVSPDQFEKDQVYKIYYLPSPCYTGTAA